jgi:hypothetical protein
MRTHAAAIASLGVLALLAAPSSGRGGPDRQHPVTVGAQRLAAAPLPALDKRIEAAWLRAEAAAQGLPASAPGVRVRVADALAGSRGQGIPASFERYHARHRAATRCLPAYRDPIADRCADRAENVASACRWMGEATLCRVAADRRRWLVVHRRPRVRRFSRRRDAVAAARSIYLHARESRARAALQASAARARRRDAAQRRRGAAERRAQRAREAARLAARRDDPHLSLQTLSAASDACVLYRTDAEPYAFGVALQDPGGQAEGLLVARKMLAARLRRAAADAIDRRKVGRLVSALAAGDRELHRVLEGGDAERLLARRGRFERATEREARVAAKLGLDGCLASA